MEKTLYIPEILEARLESDQQARSKMVREWGVQGTLTPQKWEPYYTNCQNVSVQFSLGYANTTLYAYFKVNEPEIRAEHKKHNEAICEDSCTELFIQGTDGRYCNFEANPNCALLACMGEARQNRTSLSASFFYELQIFTTKHGTKEWEILMSLPLDQTDLIDPNSNLTGQTLRGNLYKCGDKLQKPHYLAWSDVLTEKPDFHRPEFFGKFVFV